MIQEVIIYKVKQERLADFPAIRQALQEKVKPAPGFISSSFEPSVEDATVYLDVTKWETEAAMKTFNESFRELNYGAELYECADGPPVYMGVFNVS